MKTILSALGFGWSKWETIEENKRMICEESNPITGYRSGPYAVFVDVQKKTNSMTGQVKYKNVKR